MAYKETQTGKWSAQWFEDNLLGKKTKRRKRGFNTKKEALEYERKKKLGSKRSMNMTLTDFVEVYFEDKANELKERTKKNKRYMLMQHIVPYFGECKMNEISASQIVQWQNEMEGKNYSDSYLRMLQNQLTALFNHAYRIYDLEINPCRKVRRMGKSDVRSLNFWTIDDYQKFMSTIDPTSQYYVMFEILFWTGCRVGEMLALTMKDIDVHMCRLSITKTYYRTGKKDVITTPKTEQSVRIIEIPEFLCDELKSYMGRIYGLKENDRLFPVIQEAVQHKMKFNIKKSGVKKIRVHDLRHSHVAYLIDKGVDPMLIKERVGHKDIKITLNTYGHLYPNRNRTIADLLDNEKSGKERGKNNDSEGEKLNVPAEARTSNYLPHKAEPFE